MNSKIARTILLSLAALIFISSAFAGDWQHLVFQAKTAIKTDGSLPATKLVDFWVNQDRYESRFTIYKPNVKGLRVYIVVDGVSWPAFKQYTLFAATSIKSIDMPDGTKLPFGFLNMQDSALASGGITVKAGMSGQFLKLYHHQPTISVRVIGQPGQPVGNVPNVNVDVKGGVINVVKVDYPRPAVVNFGKPGIVKVKQSGQGRQSLINAVNVRGGKLDACLAVKGLNQLVCKGRRYKMTTIIGGMITGTSKTDGPIKKIYASNGLDGKVTAGEDLSPNGIRKVIAVRGGNGAIITAGGTQATPTPIGTIGKIYINLKKNGQYTTLNNCKFYSYALPKVQLNKKHAVIANVTGCSVTTPNGTTAIDAAYPNLK
ncbi:MAG: hypothetical protein DRI44_03715 [Chlamydiae bacterium]|nr:MAG: hypothetical protein DRI44_03715 [Chlamydiota bacterium]